MTFVYEADREIAFDLLDSVLRSCGNAEVDLFFTDDASPSHLGEKILAWSKAAKINAICIRDEENLGFRGAVYRTIRLLKVIASQSKTYDVILRIDTDALVIRAGLGDVLQKMCTDREGLYGVLQHMRIKDRVGFLMDLLPFGLKRKFEKGARLSDSFSLSRYHPVWWSRIGFLGLLRGFRFAFVQGSCYFLGGDVPRKLLREGFLDCYDSRRFGLITSEEDVIVTLMCKAAGIPVHETDRIDPTWRDVNIIGNDVLSRPPDLIPFVIHPLKAMPKHNDLRRKIKESLHFFGDKRSS